MAEPAGLWLAVAAAAAFVGWAWIALAMDTHWQQVQGAQGTPRGGVLLLRVAGAAGVLASASACFAADRPSMAALVWIMLQAGAAVSVALLLARKPTLLRALWPARITRHLHGMSSRSSTSTPSVRRDLR